MGAKDEEGGLEARSWVVDEVSGETHDGAAHGLPQQIGRLGYIGERQDAHVLTIQAGPRRTFCFPPFPSPAGWYSLLSLSVECFILVLYQHRRMSSSYLPSLPPLSRYNTR